MTLTLVRKRLYFGVDPLRLRDGAERVLQRVQGLPPERASVPLVALADAFGWHAEACRPMVDQMVRGGLLAPLDTPAPEYRLTDKFRRCALARIVEPLARAEAKLIVGHLADVAARFNRTATRNKYEIEALAVFGAYLRQDDDLSELSIGVTGRRRIAPERSRIGRATVATEGTDEIRALLGAHSPFIRVSFVQRLCDLPRPFSVIFDAGA